MIVLYAPTPTGGHPLYVHALAQALREVQPQRVVVVTSEDLDERFRGPDVAAILPRLALRSELGSTAAWAASRARHYPRRDAAFLAWLTDQPRAELVHWQEYTPWLLRRQVRRLGLPSVVTVHNVVPHDRRPWHRTERAGWCAARALVVHTPALRVQLQARLGPAAPPVHVTPHGVWPGPGRHDEGFTGRLLVFGALRRNKGVETAVQALAADPAWQLRVVGRGEPGYADELRSLGRRLRVEARLTVEDRFVPDVEVPAVLGAADVLLLPYRGFAAQSGVAHLALGHDLPLLCTPAGGLGELVRLHGLLPPFADVHELVERLHALAQPGAHAAAVAAVRAAAADLSWATTAERTAAVYRSVLPAAAA